MTMYFWVPHWQDHKPQYLVLPPAYRTNSSGRHLSVKNFFVKVRMGSARTNKDYSETARKREGNDPA